MMKPQPDLMVEDFSYDLPESLIAQTPAKNRDMSRLMVLERLTGEIRHRHFKDLPEYLHPGDLLIMNDVKVIPARLFARKSTGARIEVFILDGFQTGSTRRALMKPARRIRIGEILILNDGVSLEILQRIGKEFLIALRESVNWDEYLDRFGCMPLPPYIRRVEDDSAGAMDRERYQTVVAHHPGAVAAPTAGLHFTPELLEKLRLSGVLVRMITLWVGWGTFKPVESIRVADHRMDEEVYSVPDETRMEVLSAKAEGRRVIAVGTTTTRALESWASDAGFTGGIEKRRTGIFISPGYRFGVIDALITNFHLPCSTLIMLVSAFAGRRNVLSAYQVAVAERYRFFSYGDAMLIQ